MDIDASAASAGALARITARDSPDLRVVEHRAQGIGVGWDLGSSHEKCSPALRVDMNISSGGGPSIVNKTAQPDGPSRPSED